MRKKTSAKNRKKAALRPPVLSVVVPTFNRCGSLGRLLDSLARLKTAPGTLEVIVADDGSTDATRAQLAKRRDPFVLRVLRAETSSGPSAARNRGAAAARGAVLGFLDSDVTVHPDWWLAAAPHFKNPKVAAVEGATEPPADAPQPTPFTHFVANRRGGSFQTCNFLCRAAVFKRIGGFDGRFCWRDARGKLWHIREDTDLAFSILEAGFKIVFEPRALGWHPLVPASPWVYWRETRFGLREALLRRKHPRLYAQRLGWVDGRAFPVFYWGLYLGLPGLVLGGWRGPAWAAGGAAGVLLLGWAGSIYAVCRKRKVSPADLFRLAPQFFLIPWLRLAWVLRGEWMFRKVKPQAPVQ
jgi:glycosyltransferase involved in cell wall biosynthesis